MKKIPLLFLVIPLLFYQTLYATIVKERNYTNEVYRVSIIGPVGWYMQYETKSSYKDTPEKLSKQSVLASYMLVNFINAYPLNTIPRDKQLYIEVKAFKSKKGQTLKEKIENIINANNQENAFVENFQVIEGPKEFILNGRRAVSLLYEFNSKPLLGAKDTFLKREIICLVEGNNKGIYYWITSKGEANNFNQHLSEIEECINTFYAK